MISSSCHILMQLSLVFFCISQKLHFHYLYFTFLFFSYRPQSTTIRQYRNIITFLNFNFHSQRILFLQSTDILQCCTDLVAPQIQKFWNFFLFNRLFYRCRRLSVSVSHTSLSYHVFTSNHTVSSASVTSSRQFLRGRFLFLRSGGVLSNIFRGHLLSYILFTCPNQFNCVLLPVLLWFYLHSFLFAHLHS